MTKNAKSKSSFLKLKPNVTAKGARNSSSLGLVYLCPKCGVGHALVHISPVTGTVKCGLCGGTFQKP